MDQLGARPDRLHALAATCTRACRLADRVVGELTQLAGQVREAEWVQGPAAPLVERNLAESARVLSAPADLLRRFAKDLDEQARQQTLVSMADRVAAADTTAISAKGPFEAAVAAEDWKTVVTLLNGYDDAELVRRVRALFAAGYVIGLTTAAEAQGTNGRVYRAVRYVRAGVEPEQPHDAEYQYTRNNDGRLVHVAQVGQGVVEVHFGVDVHADSPQAGPDGIMRNGVEFRYIGADDANTRWLRFGWDEIIVERADMEPYRLTGVLGSSSGGITLTPDPPSPEAPLAPNYFVDTGKDANSPFYEAQGADLRDTSSTTIFDRPQPFVDENMLRALLVDDGDRVVAQTHFTSYLVQGMEVKYRVETTVTWTYDDIGDYERDAALYGPDPVRDITVILKDPEGRPLTGPVSQLDPKHRERLLADRFGGYDYLR